MACRTDLSSTRPERRSLPKCSRHRRELAQLSSAALRDAHRAALNRFLARDAALPTAAPPCHCHAPDRPSFPRGSIRGRPPGPPIFTVRRAAVDEPSDGAGPQGDARLVDRLPTGAVAIASRVP